MLVYFSLSADECTQALKESQDIRIIFEKNARSWCQFSVGIGRKLCSAAISERYKSNFIGLIRWLLAQIFFCRLECSSIVFRLSNVEQSLGVVAVVEIVAVQDSLSLISVVSRLPRDHKKAGIQVKVFDQRQACSTISADLNSRLPISRQHGPSALV